MATPSFCMPVGSIVSILASSATPPNNWIYCDGQTYDTEQYDALYEVLQTAKVPDLRGYVLIGAGTYTGNGQSYVQKQMYGNVDHTLLQEEMPSHQHFGWGESGNGPFGKSQASGYPGSGKSDSNNYLYGTSFAGGHGDDSTVIPTTDGQVAYSSPAANTAFSLLQPSYAVNYFIYAGPGA